MPFAVSLFCTQEGFKKVDHDYCMKVAELAKQNGCEQYHLVSSTGANAKSTFLYQKVKVRWEDIPGGPKKMEVRFFFFFLGLCSDQQLSFFNLLDRASFPHYDNTKMIKFGWELFILWGITYGLSFSGFAIDLSLIVPRNSGNRANPENDSPWEITHKIKGSQPNLMILVLL